VLIAGQRDDRALSRKCIVAAYLFKSANTGASAARDWQLLRRLRVLRIHVHDEVRVFVKRAI